MMSEAIFRGQSLVRALNPRFALVLIHSVINCPFPLPRVGGFKFYVFQGDGFWELLHHVPGWQDGLEKVKLALVKGFGELDVKFDVEVTGFVVSLGRHTLAMDDFQVAWRVSSVECRKRHDVGGLTIVDNLAGKNVDNKSTIVQMADCEGTTSEGR